MRIEGEQRCRIGVGVDVLWAVIADVERAPDWSPDCLRCDWVDGAVGPAVGARFVGSNRMPFVGVWRSHCTVTACVPGHTFGFAVGGPDVEHPNSIWEYHLLPVDDHTTELTERYAVLHEPWTVALYYRLARRDRHLERTVAESLQRLARIGRGEPMK